MKEPTIAVFRGGKLLFLEFGFNSAFTILQPTASATYWREVECCAGISYPLTSTKSTRKRSQKTGPMGENYKVPT